ncbi:MAG: hydroxylamine reductase [Spirochaetia bacterium]|nr:hydroxylamine reductase [Spirochaetia bacterium]
MFCYQCQETAKNIGCTVRGVCGKDETTANHMDVLVYAVKGLAHMAQKKAAAGKSIKEEGNLILRALFSTITNANFDVERIKALIYETIDRTQKLVDQYGQGEDLPEYVQFAPKSDQDLEAAFDVAAVKATEDEDIRSLREFIIYGIKGIAAYGDHASILGFENEEVYREVIDELVATTENLSIDELAGVLVQTGNTAVKTMALLDQANTSTYGHPEITKVNIGTRSNPGILISGHDLKDMSELLEQTQGTGVDVYTHSEMLPANYYPAFKKYNHFVGNYGGSWYKQGSEFSSFNGPILMTTNCIIPVRDAYKDRIFTTGMAGYPEVPHIPDRTEGGKKDFSKLIELAKSCKPPEQIEEGEIIGGFAHHQVELLADKVVEAVKSGAIKKFIVMGGCDGRMKSREYFTEFAKQLPKDTVIMASGCAKYRYNKLNLGEIDGIPRVLDAGQCNDSYSIASIALTLQKAFELDDVNDLPVDFAVAWYEQKAVCVLLALLALGFKGVRIGPTLPAFVSENVKQKIIDTFGLKVTTEVESDIAAVVS